MEISGRKLAFRLDKRRSPGARLVALRTLDLDDVGAEIGEGLPGCRAGENARKLEDPDASKRTLRRVEFSGAAGGGSVCGFWPSTALRTVPPRFAGG
jgi:hypothetical protein